MSPATLVVVVVALVVAFIAEVNCYKTFTPFFFSRSALCQPFVASDEKLLATTGQASARMTGDGGVAANAGGPGQSRAGHGRASTMS